MGWHMVLVFICSQHRLSGCIFQETLGSSMWIQEIFYFEQNIGNKATLFILFTDSEIRL